MNIFNKYKELPFQKRIQLTSRVSMIFNFIWAGIKVVIGIFIRFNFLWVSGIYTFCLGLSKQYFFRGIKKENINKLLIYKNMALCLMFASLFYMAYSYFEISNTNLSQFSKIAGITLALVSFLDIGFSIYNIFKVRKHKDLLVSGLKEISLASSLTSLVLTQSALLSFEISENLSIYNSFSGLLFGFISLIISILMLGKFHKILFDK